MTQYDSKSEWFIYHSMRCVPKQTEELCFETMQKRSFSYNPTAKSTSLLKKNILHQATLCIYIVTKKTTSLLQSY